MTTWACARCTRTDQTRMRNSALCQDCWRALAEAGLRWCPRCREARPLFRRGGYCPDCQRAFDRERNADPSYRAAARARNARWMARQKERTMTTDRCQQCGGALTREQQKNANQCCSPRCARMWKASAPRSCPACGGVVATGKKYCNQRCRRAWEGRRATPHATEANETPTPLGMSKGVAQNGSCAVGDILGREGATTYRVDLLNGRLYVFDGPGRVYCALGVWATSTAGRRLAKQGERSVFDEVKAGRRQYPVQEEL